ncbi:hypothetical protein [Haladaptatus sp. CMSO5]|uniref:hypothetical protein n=1 Tax=Haladaptatus sp. CMSO5 TaxID=3120514 RepID=UPI002FCDFBFC
MDDSDTIRVAKTNQTRGVIFAVSLIVIGILGSTHVPGLAPFFWGLGGLGLFVSGVYFIRSFPRPE